MRFAPLRAALATVLAAGALVWASPSHLNADEGKALPEFRYAVAEAWLNSPPITNAQLRGKVVLIDLFTTG